MTEGLTDQVRCILHALSKFKIKLLILSTTNTGNLILIYYYLKKKTKKLDQNTKDIRKPVKIDKQLKICFKQSDCHGYYVLKYAP